MKSNFPDEPSVAGIEYAAELYEWADLNFFWNDHSFGTENLITEVKTGRSLINGSAEDGIKTHDWWKIEVNANGAVEWTDKREWGFVEIKNSN